LNANVEKPKKPYVKSKKVLGENKRGLVQIKTRTSKKHSTQNDAGHLNPQKFSDACEILGLGQGCTLKE
jgi:hypothetical protein